MILANATNGLAFPHDQVCYFQSQFAHHIKLGYFRLDSMPVMPIIHLLNGGEITIVDATKHDKPLSDGLKYGVPTWCGVYNAALGFSHQVCEWETREMRYMYMSNIHSPVRHLVRKLARVTGHSKPITIGENVKLVCHKNFKFDDMFDSFPMHTVWRNQ